MATESPVSEHCAVCGGPLAADAADAVCPRCALGGALGLSPGQPRTDPAGEASEAGGKPLESPKVSPTAGAFGEYELLEKVGEGGMGVVFKARQKSLDRIVAIKMLRLGPHAAPEFVKRFRAEAVAAASLQHPHIVAIHEVGAYQGQQYFVMDYVEGQSLARLVGNQPLPARQAAQYVHMIAEAVHCAHEHGILHRDLKPANVLVDAENQVRVMDFGLARRLEGDSELTLTGQVLGSPHYMPPEQAVGKRGRVSRRTDVYGLGAILYHLLTGRPPFVGEELAEMFQHVLNTDPVPPRLLNPAVPRDLETICLKCLEKEPARRYPTAIAVADELGRYLQDQPIAARPVGRREKVWRWCRRQPVRAGLIGAVLAVLLLGGFGVLWQWQRAERQRQLAESQRQHAQQLAYVADMRLAFQAMEDDRRGDAWELLNRYWPAASAPSTDLRGWEWRHLWKRCETDADRMLTNYDILIAGLAVSADGRWLAVSSFSNIMVWDLANLQFRERVPVTAVPGAVDLSADGRLVACAEADFTGPTEMPKNFNAVVFDTRTRTITRFPHPATTWWLQVALSRDARVLASHGWNRDEGLVQVWGLEAKQCFCSIRVPPGGALQDSMLRFSPDGKALRIGQTDGHVRIIDWATTNLLQDIPPPGTNNPLATLAFAPNGRQLAASYGGGVLSSNIYLWDVEPHRPAGQLVGHRNAVYSLRFLPDGKKLASASGDGTVRLWDVAKQTEIRRFFGHRGAVYGVATPLEGKTLVSGGRDGCVYFWTIEHRKTEFATGGLPVSARDFAFTPDSRYVVTVNYEGRIEVWDTEVLEPVRSVPLAGTNTLCLAIASRGDQVLLAAGTEAGGVQVWDITSLAAPQVVTNFNAHNSRVAALKFDPHGHILMSAAFAPGAWADPDPGNFRAWDTSSWTNRPEFSAGSHQVAYLPKPSLLVIRRAPLGVYFAVRNLLTGEEKIIAPGHGHTLATLAFSPDGRWLASGSYDGTVKLWDVNSWRCETTFSGMGPSVRDLAFSPDSRRLITGSNPVKLWDLATCSELASLSLDSAIVAGKAVAFSPDGNTLAVRDQSGKIHFWRAPPLAEIERATRRPHTALGMATPQAVHNVQAN